MSFAAAMLDMQPLQTSQQPVPERLETSLPCHDAIERGAMDECFAGTHPNGADPLSWRVLHAQAHVSPLHAVQARAAEQS